MANYYLTITPVDTLSTSTYSIYFDEIKASNLLFSGVPQSTLVAGFLVYFTGSAASATSVYVKNEDPDCCCAVKSYIFPTPSPTTSPTTAPTTSPTTAAPTTSPTTAAPTTASPTTAAPTTSAPTTPQPTTLPPSTPNPTSLECASKEYRINNTTGTDVYWGGTNCNGNSIGGTVGAYTIGNTPCVKDGTFTYSGFPTVTVLSIC